MSTTSSESMIPQGKPFIVKECGFSAQAISDYSVLDLAEDKILDWPMLYILHNKKEAYVGQTTSVRRRIKEHEANPSKKAFKHVDVIFNEEFNQSVITDYESRIIQLMHADDKYRLTNKNKGLSDSNYFSKQEYARMFDELWRELRDIGLVSGAIADLEESEVFKYSPFKNLTVDQQVALEKIQARIKGVFGTGDEKGAPLVVEGVPGTGKTVLAIYLLKALKDDPDYRNLNIKLVVAPRALRASVRKVFKNTVNLSPKDVLGPADLKKRECGFLEGEKGYDILLVDEAHRLRQRKNVGDPKTFIDTNLALGLDEYAGELEWIMNQAKMPVFFFDEMQVIGPNGTDGALLRRHVGELSEEPIKLESQMRVKGGGDYLEYIRAILEDRQSRHRGFKSYEFRLVEDYRRFNELYAEKKQQHELTRMIAGFAWPWATKGGKPGFDIEIEGVRRRWNRTNVNWVGIGFNDPTATEEVGCIHSIQGYDLSYAFVILGNDIRYDSAQKRIVVDPSSYFDKNGKKKTSQAELDQYVRNIYYVLLTRGMYGTYLYICDPALRERFRRFADVV